MYCLTDIYTKEKEKAHIRVRVCARAGIASII